MRRNVFLLWFLLLSLSVRAQSPYIPLNADYYHLIDRLEIRNHRWAEGFHSSVKPYNRQSVVALTDSLLSNPYYSFSDTDYFNFAYLRDDSWEWVTDSTNTQRHDPFTKHLRSTGPGDSERPFLNIFYKKKADFYSLRTPDVDLHVSPVFYAGLGLENVTRQTDVTLNEQQRLFVNTRGLEVRGTLGGKVGFYTFFSDNQAQYPEYVRTYGLTYSRYQGQNGSSPGEGFIKRYPPNGLSNGVDFLSARGYITLNPLKIMNLQFGHDRTFFGNGFRSLLLSDNSPPYLFLKLTTRLGRRIQYTNLFSQLINAQALIPQGDKLIPPKFSAMHHLSININDYLNVGVFEAEVFSRDRLDLTYLNPVILYRYVESAQGSADNAMVGLDFKANFLSQFLVYTQFMIDEFRLNALRQARGDWTNKFALQLGAKYIDAFNVPNLDLQAEMNLARPFTYAHERSATVSAGQTNYAHYNQPLAHPLGANFLEGLGILRYQRKRLSGSGIFGVMMYGSDPPASGNLPGDLSQQNYGGNILSDYNTRKREEGNFIGQGRKNIVTYADLRASYMVRHNVFLEGRFLYRYQDSQYRPDQNTSQVASFALRWNFPHQNWVF